MSKNHEQHAAATIEALVQQDAAAVAHAIVEQAAAPHDFQVQNEGSVILVRPLTPEARAWVDEHVEVEDWAWLGTAFACDPRYVADLVALIGASGFTVELI